MTKLNQEIGAEEISPPPEPQPKPGSFRSIIRHPSKKRKELGKVIWKEIVRIYGDEPEYPWAVVKEEGYLFCVVLWDHWQENLELIACSERPEASRRSEKESLWMDSSDGELGP